MYASKNRWLNVLAFLAVMLTSSLCALADNVSVRDFGAVGDGQANDTGAIQKALDDVAGKGGGGVKVPAGKYLTGSLVMKSKTILYLERDAILLGSSNKDDYPLIQSRWEGRTAECHRALVSADHAHDIAIVGEGTIQGNPQVSVLRDPRGPTVVEMIECSNVRVEGITLKSTRIWTLHPTYCHDVTISKVIFETSGGNGDGIDPDSCQKVLIDRCTFSTNDDNIAIKSGKGQEGAKIGRPCEDITITNCTFLKGNSGVCFGSELSGGIRRVKISNCTFKEEKGALFLKLRPTRGGYVEDITAEHLVVGPCPLLITDMSYQNLVDPQGIPGKDGQTQFGRIKISDVQIDSERLLNIQGMVDKPLDGLEITGVHGTVKEASVLQHVKNVVFKDIELKGLLGAPYLTKDAEGSGLDGAVPFKK